jgi:hypothetical protein
MSGSARIPGLVRASLIVWRARRIANPGRRLRYLRGATAQSSARRFGSWTRVACVVCLSFVPFQPVRNAIAPRPWKSAASSAAERLPAVWLVEQDRDHESYSNGLRIENRYLVDSRPRRYAVFARDNPDADRVDWRTGPPAGIVYHSTESDMAPLEPEQSARQLQFDEALLDYVRRRRSYHFVIDRFGRVYRVVAENDAASHAGHSVWVDAHWVYLNLNTAFLGVAFESRTENGQEKPLEPPQIQAGRMLTDLLRSRYRLPTENCITHAQVSVNPGNMRIAYHTDWASNFPFAAMGLPDNYGEPVAGVEWFGFGYDPALVDASGGRAWPGLLLAQQNVAGEAIVEGLSAAEYVRLLHHRYRRKIAALERQGAALQNNEEIPNEH